MRKLCSKLNWRWQENQSRILVIVFVMTLNMLGTFAMNEDDDFAAGPMIYFFHFLTIYPMIYAHNIHGFHICLEA